VFCIVFVENNAFPTVVCAAASCDLTSPFLEMLLRFYCDFTAPFMCSQKRVCKTAADARAAAAAAAAAVAAAAAAAVVVVAA
jgi:hypothetical protein